MLFQWPSSSYVVNKVITFLAFGISLLSKVLLYLPVQVVSEVEET